jgi:hypothetical protein
MHQRNIRNLALRIATRAITVFVVIAMSFAWAAPRKRTAAVGKPVHVRQYTRKNGTVVQEHYRAAPWTPVRQAYSNGARSKPLPASGHTPPSPTSGPARPAATARLTNTAPKITSVPRGAPGQPIASPKRTALPQSGVNRDRTGEVSRKQGQ